MQIKKLTVNGEEFVMVPDFAGYFCSASGKILSTILAPPKILTPSMHRDGYHKITIKPRASKAMTIQAHRFVALALVPNPKSKKQVNHINGKKTDNRAANLEWVTPSENGIHCVNVLGGRLGERNGNRKLCSSDVLKIRKLLRRGTSQRNIGKMFGVAQSQIQLIAAGKAWRHV